MDSIERQSGAAALETDAFQQTVEILQWASQSPHVPTRRNTLLAWAALASSDNLDRARQTSATKGLIDAALHELPGDELNEQLIAFAAKQIATLPQQEQIALAYRDVLSRAGGGSSNAYRAALLAQLLAATQSYRNQVRAYAAALHLSFRTCLSTLRDGLLLLITASLISTIIVIFVFYGIGRALPLPLGYVGITDYDLARTGILTAFTAAAFSVPRALTPRRGQRYLEAIVNSLIVSVVLVAWFFFVPTKAELTFYGLESQSNYLFNGVSSFPGIIAVLVGMAGGRIAAGLFSSSSLTWRAIYSSVVAGAGWGLLFQWVTATSLDLWFDQTSSTPAIAVHGSVAILAGLAAYGWRDSAAQRRDRSKLDRGGWLGASDRQRLSALITALTGWLLMLACIAASFVITFTEIRKETFEFNKGFKPIERVAIDNDSLKIDCTTGKQNISVDQVKTGTYYRCRCVPIIPLP
jgi:hypothetical protein